MIDDTDVEGAVQAMEARVVAIAESMSRVPEMKNSELFIRLAVFSNEIEQLVPECDEDDEQNEERRRITAVVKSIVDFRQAVSDELDKRFPCP